MKKIIVFIIFLLNIGYCFAQNMTFYDCVSYQGYWTQWEKNSGKFFGGYDNMTLTSMLHDPWQYYMSFTIDNFVYPTNIQKQEHIRENKEYIYTGTCEYYICDQYPNITEIIKKFKHPLHLHPEANYSKTHYTNLRKVKQRVTIAIAPFENVPSNYTIVFGEVKYAFYFPNGIYFNK